MANNSLRALLREHLALWGLRPFTSDSDYFAWQRRQLSSEDLKRLALHIERRREGDRLDEIAFYDLAADPRIFPVLYSQRYEYYEEIGRRTVACLGEAESILDFGCGLGILTTFYARQFPEKTFVGLDRSCASIAVARHKASELRLDNIRFECVDVEVDALSGVYDLVITTHVLMQAEHDPGLPSRSWQTFERRHDPSQQSAFEQRTGLGIRLDRVCEVLRPDGRMIVSEKTRQLARRVPFQRALSRRGFGLVEPADLIHYRSVEEMVDDGPFYLVQRGLRASSAWDEMPERDEGLAFAQNVALTMSGPDGPLYENHWPSAQVVWERLRDRAVVQETTRQEPDGRQVHVERGTAGELSYLYCANTFDQRQVVIDKRARSAMIDAYYQEIVRELP
ncbi:MAG: methyltransferase domain-containing protein [Nitrospira sp.]|nr:methyltransferase domain-containing protein [Nitrospira sp.]